MPACASEISPGRGGEPPPTSATALALWCGERTGRWPKRRTSRPSDDTLSNAALESASPGVISGSSPARRSASIDLPAPGGPINSSPCAPAAATSSARRAPAWPFTSARSGNAGDGTRQLARQPGQLARGDGVVVARQERLDDVAERAGRTDVDAFDPGRLERALRREHQPAATPALAHGQRERQRAANRAQFSGQRQFAGEFATRQPGNVQQALRGEHAQSDGQIEAAGFLGQVGGRQVDRDLLVVGEGEPALRERRPHALAGLLDLGVGQADEREAGQAVGEVDFDLHFGRVQSDERAAVDDGQRHGGVFQGLARTPSRRHQSF